MRLLERQMKILLAAAMLCLATSAYAEDCHKRGWNDEWFHYRNYERQHIPHGWHHEHCWPYPWGPYCS